MEILIVILGGLTPAFADHPVRLTHLNFQAVLVIESIYTILDDAYGKNSLTEQREDEIYSDLQWPVMKVSLPVNLTSFTLCHSYYTWRLEFQEIRLSGHDNNIWLTVHFGYRNPPSNTRANNFTRIIHYKIYGHDRRIADLQFSMPSWDYFCHSFDLLNGVVDLHANGAAVVQGLSVKGLNQSETTIQGLLSDMTVTMHKFDFLSQLRIFSNRPASFGCSSPSDDSLLYNWSRDAMSYDSRFLEYPMLEAELCNKTEPFQLLVNYPRHFYDAVDNCRKFGRGLLPNMDNNAALKSFGDMLHEGIFKKWQVGTAWENKQFVAYWMPYTKEPMSGLNYTNHYTGRKPDIEIPYQDHFEPLGHKCVWCHRGGCVTDECDRVFNYICLFDTPPLVALQGLCPNSDLDKLYHPRYTQVFGTGWDLFVWTGLRRTFMTHFRWERRWVIKVLGSPVWAESTASEDSLLLGTSTWTVHNDFNCFSNRTVEVELSLNACHQDEFNCNDGFCVPLDARCDGEVDCPDESDELSCKVLSSLESSNRMTPAAQTKVKGERGPVKILVDILHVLGVTVGDGKIRLKMRVSMEWFDARLEYLNLRQINLLDEAECASIWIPSLRYKNMEVNILTHAVNQEATVYVLKNDSYRPRVSGFEMLHREKLYDGCDNTLHWTSMTSSNYLCVFNLDHYPFDVQVCAAILSLEEEQLLTLRPLPHKLTFGGVSSIDQFSITKIQMCNLMVADEETVYIELTIERELLGFFLTVCLPTMLVNVVGHLTNYFKEDEFDLVIGVNLTTMLVITTMYVGILDALPLTQGIKMVDIWMLFSLTIPTMDVFLQTYIHATLDNTDSDNNGAADSDKWAFSSRINRKLEDIGKVLGMNKVQQRWTSAASRVELGNLQKGYIARKILTVGKPIIAIIFCVGFWIVGVYLLDRDRNKLAGSENYYNCIVA